MHFSCITREKYICTCKWIGTKLRWPIVPNFSGHSNFIFILFYSIYFFIFIYVIQYYKIFCNLICQREKILILFGCVLIFQSRCPKLADQVKFSGKSIVTFPRERDMKKWKLFINNACAKNSIHVLDSSQPRPDENLITRNVISVPKNIRLNIWIKIRLS